MAITLSQALTNLSLGQHVAASFEILYMAYHARVHSFLRQKGLSESEASDAAQEVFLSVFRNLPQLRDPDRFEPWLFTIARHRVAQNFEHASAMKRGAGLLVDLQPHPDASRCDVWEGIPDRRPDPLAELLDREKLDFVTRLLADLPTQMRRCVVARLMDHQSVEEIARSLGISANTIKVHLHRARLVLSERLRVHFSEALRDE